MLAGGHDAMRRRERWEKEDTPTTLRLIGDDLDLLEFLIATQQRTQRRLTYGIISVQTTLLLLLVGVIANLFILRGA